MEVWIYNKLKASVNLTEEDKHGKVYFDGGFGCLDCDPDSGRVVYVAEKKRPKSPKFFGATKAEVLPGQEFNYVEDWGEQLTDKSLSVICIYDWALEQVRVLDLDENYCYGPVYWLDKESLFGVATKIGPYRLPPTSKPSRIIRIHEKSGETVLLSKGTELVHCNSPRINPQKQFLVWLERDLGQKAHSGCSKLVSLSLVDSLAQVELVIDVKKEFDPEIDQFAGLFQSNLPQRCFVSDHEIAFSDTVVDTRKLMVCNITQKTLHVTKENLVVLDASNGVILARKSQQLVAPSLWRMNYENGDVINLTPLIEQEVIEADKWHCETLFHKNDVLFSSIFVGSKTEKGPLILWPHGGPHVAMEKAFKNELIFWLKLGFSVLMPNYRGSLGMGQDFVESLIGQNGTKDVLDCFQAVKECLEKFPNLESNRVFLYGGSHGGFLVAHLAGQYPDFFKAAVARNPVVNLATKLMTCDNPINGFDLNGLQFQHLSPTPQEMEVLYRHSPIKYSNDVKIPIHLNLGSTDKRVVMSQGLEFYKNLKAQGKQVSINVYEDNHPLAKRSSYCNILINAFLFYQQA